jgi:protein-disulfide isomerase
MSEEDKAKTESEDTGKTEKTEISVSEKESEIENKHGEKETPTTDTPVMSPSIDAGDTITINKHTLWMYSTFILAAVVIIGGFMAFSGSDGGGAPTGAVIVDNPTPTAPPPTASLEIKDTDAVRGNPDAPVIIFEYSDFECPFCSRAHPTVKQVMDTYGDDVAIVYRHFPLSFHPQAQKAAEASECAKEIGGNEKFWEMHDLLFESGVTGGVDSFKSYATQIGLDSGAFNKCLDSGQTAAKVRADFSGGQQAGVTGTPGFFVNGRKINGAQPFSAFQQIIDAELA